MSFDFGTRSNEAADPTTDFVSKFPDLDGAGGDDALLSSAAATSGSGAGVTGNALDDDDLLGGGGSSATPAPAAASEEHSKEHFESNFPELDDPDLNAAADMDEPAAAPAPQSTVSERDDAIIDPDHR